MKTQTNILNALNTNDLQLLTAQVSETLATHVDLSSTNNNFKAIDFWNLQRIQKSRSCGRFPSISVR